MSISWLLRAGRRARLVALAGCALWLAWSAPSLAQADEFEDFQQARALYEAGDYAQAAERFEALVGGDSARLRSRPLRLESLKYLAASYLFLERRQAAVRQFERLLQEDIDYQLDPLAFPAEVQDVFRSVRTRLLDEREAQRRREQRRQAEQQRRRAARERAVEAQRRRLLELASTETVERVNSRWIALLPFGVGQFQNGHEDWGTFFAISQGSLALIAAASFVGHELLPDPDDPSQRPAPSEVDDANLAETAFRLTNQASVALLVGLAIWGIVDAQVRFRSRIVRHRRRTLPAELLRAVEVDPAEQSMRFQIRF